MYENADLTIWRTNKMTCSLAYIPAFHQTSLKPGKWVIPLLNITSLVKAIITTWNEMTLGAQLDTFCGCVYGGLNMSFFFFFLNTYPDLFSKKKKQKKAVNTR